MHSTDPTSPKWPTLPEQERYDVLRAIERSFRGEYGGHRGFLYATATDTVLLVTTSLPRGTVLAGLPSDFRGLPVKQDAIKENMDAFIAAWRGILTNIARWDPPRIERCIEEIGAREFTSTWFGHDPPSSNVVHFLIPEEARAIVGMARCHMYEELREALATGVNREYCPFGWFPQLDPKYDWDAARDRVEATVQKYLKVSPPNA